MIASTIADTLYFSKDAIAKAKEPKELFLLDGKTHVGLYDGKSISVPKLVDCVNKALSG